jgi:predicted amidophosphoribosyltransferase
MEAQPAPKRQAARNRHIPRVCHSCHAPMASQEDTCWRCGTQWASEDGKRTPLTLIPGGASDARLATDRWANEGGSVAAEAAIRTP